MSFVLTPAALSPSMTSSISSLDELASGLPTGFIFTPTTSPGSKKPAPGRDGVIGAGELLHAAIDGLLDRLAVLDVVLDHPRIADLDDPSRDKAPGHPISRLGSALPAAALGSWAET